MFYCHRILLFFLLFIPSFFWAQEKVIVLDWSSSKTVQWGTQSFQLDVVKGFELDNRVPFYALREKTTIKHAAVAILNPVYEKLPNAQVDAYHTMGMSFDTTVQLDAKIVSDAGQFFLSVYVLPIRMTPNGLERLVSFEVSIQPLSSQGIQKDYASHSVLASGSWYRIAVTKDGIYKLDKAFLEACGIQTAGLNPAHIHIYGNGEGLMPELNSTPRTDDLAQNALFIQGEADGSFDAADYVLFYGWGPHRWNLGAGYQYDQTRHPYADQSYYYIHIDASIAPKRIVAETQVIGVSDTTITAYDFRDIYENDLVNLAKGGQRWYGEEFDVNLTQTFNFSIPSVVALPVTYKITYASSARDNSNSIAISRNNQLLKSSPLSFTSSDYIRGTLSVIDSFPVATNALKLQVNRSNPAVVFYLDRILVNAKRNLSFYGSQMGFRVSNWPSTAAIATYQLSNATASGFVWDITDKHNPIRMNTQLLGSELNFTSNAGYREFVYASGASYFTPDRIGNVELQDLHGLDQANYIIVAHPDFLVEANRLANLHRDEGLTVHVVTPQQVYNEFSSGMQDPAAIRRFLKMFYDRALASDPTTKPNYLLLFGDGTYDPKNRLVNNNNYVVTYQMPNSENKTDAMVVDDFFGLLDDNEAMSAADILDIGVGRMIVSSALQAKQMVDKVAHYMKNGSNLFPVNSSCCMGTQTEKTFGDWRLKYMVLTDNREHNYFIDTDAEPQYAVVRQFNPEINYDKLYMDAFPKEVTAGGERFPDMVKAIDNGIQRGALIVNYIGHGGEVGLAAERVVSIDQINAWTNIHALHLFVSATCEFTRFDDPERVSAGEWVYLNPNGGAIAMLTTTRSVYFGVNSNIGQKYIERVFNRYPDGTSYTFGDIARRTKNAADASSTNKRTFTLIGDPALRLSMPRYRIVTDSINGLDPTVELDTLKALSKVRIKGHLEDYSGAILTTFNGVLNPTIFDKTKTLSTLGQDSESPATQFQLQQNKVYRGQSSIVNGYFDFEFVVPKDIALNYGYGKISYYGQNGSTDAQGYDTLLIIGGIDPNGVNDVQGPSIQLFMNQESFVNGSITDENPVLLAKIQDENGVNTVGNGIGHDIVATLDGQTASPIVLNDFYTAELNSYQKGELRYQFSNLSPGKHQLQLKVWDVNNNSSLSTIDFVVQEKQSPTLSHVLNYPNPFTTRTEFMFEHNQSCSALDVQIQIYTISGKLVKTIQQNVPTQGFRISGILWDGRDEFGDELARGTYIYQLKIQTPDGLVATQSEKLVLLK
ncbi:MAG: hypothetical protein RLZZ301_557 [Bacteroidota bacterium]